MSGAPAVAIVPTVGRIVLYCMGASEAQQINDRRRTMGTLGNGIAEGDVFPAMVVRVWSEDCVNLKVMLDGDDTHWATSRQVSEGPVPFRFHWMAYQKAQAGAQ